MIKSICRPLGPGVFPGKLGTTINMDGTALYQGTATVSLAQVFGVELSLATLFLIVVTGVGASIGTPASGTIASS